MTSTTSAAGGTDARVDRSVPDRRHHGDARVDAVLASLAPLETAPVSEHVAVFESAIAQLRSALDDAGSRSS